MQRQFVAIAAGICVILASCAGGRWRGAIHEDVQIEDSSYGVNWLRSADGIDANSHSNAGLVLLPDSLTEKHRATEAMTVIARRECRTGATIMTETNIGPTYLAQFRCAK